MREAQLRTATTLNKALMDAKSKSVARLAKCASTHQQQQVRPPVGRAKGTVSTGDMD